MKRSVTAASPWVLPICSDTLTTLTPSRRPVYRPCRPRGQREGVRATYGNINVSSTKISFLDNSLSMLKSKYFDHYFYYYVENLYSGL